MGFLDAKEGIAVRDDRKLSTQEKPTKTRAGLNGIIPGLIYQRGKILTWTRDVKQRKLDEWGVTAVVNFWPKADADLGEIPLDWYWQISCPRSEQMLEPRIMDAAQAVVAYLRADDAHRSVLVLCEAGKTRSVFFCILLYHLWYDVPLLEAEAAVLEIVSGASLKGFMEEWLRQ